MTNLFKKLSGYVAVGVGVVGAYSLTASYAFAAFGATEITNIVSSTTDNIESVLTTALPVIFLLGGALIALRLGWKYVKKVIK